jgi:hypothetical protein
MYPHTLAASSSLKGERRVRPCCGYGELVGAAGGTIGTGTGTGTSGTGGTGGGGGGRAHVSSVIDDCLGRRERRPRAHDVDTVAALLREEGHHARVH